MSLVRLGQLCAIVVIVGCCRSNKYCNPVAAPACHARVEMPQAQSAATVSVPSADRAPVANVSFRQSAPCVVDRFESDSADLADGQLSLPQFVEEVQARNPSIQAMIAAWRSAAQRYPQVVALEDPMFMTMMAPASFNSSDVESAYVLEGSQKIPWFGKRGARGRIAQAEANAASQDANETRLLIVEAAQVAFFDYYLVRRQQDLNRSNMQVLRQFYETAEAKYRGNQVSQRDVLQAQLELAELDRRQNELDRMDALAVARINTLLRRPPRAPLAPPPTDLGPATTSADLDLLQQVAIQQRPDIAALGARVRAEQASVALACKAYYPDGEFFGRYDSFWQPASTQSDLRGQVGVRLNVPLYTSRLDAAVREAQFRLSQRQAEFEQKRLDIQYEVETAYAQLEEGRKSLLLYSEKLIPFAEQNVSAARANYDVGNGSFLDLASAQRQLIGLREKHQEATAIYHRRFAELNRVAGGTIPTAAVGEVVPLSTQ